MNYRRAKPVQLSRRSLLRGAGTAVALPLLEAMLPLGASAFAASAIPTRMIAWYVPNGIHMPAWRPSREGYDYDLPPTLEPLAPYRDKLLVLSNLANRPGKADGAGDHAAGTGAFLTATRVRKTEGSDLRNGISMDQVAAAAIGRTTRFPSLEIGLEGGGTAGSCDSGYSCAYTRNISWSGPQTPKPKMIEPWQVYQRLFQSEDAGLGAETYARREARRASVLDSVLEDIHRLSPRLGAADRAKLDEYLQSITELEHRLGSTSAMACQDVKAPPAHPDLEDKIGQLLDLMTIAFQCDLTRVQTFMLANAGSWRSFGFLGIDQAHHEVSHHQQLPSNHEKLKVIDRWEVAQFGRLLQRLESTVDITGRALLDSCTILFSSEISDGNLHNHHDLPVLLAGSANGYFATGRHIRYSSEQPIANLFISMLDSLGVQVESFGDDGSAPLVDLGNS